MNRKLQVFLLIMTGIFVGFVNGFLGAGGGMILVPLIMLILGLKTKIAHATAILIILPICLISGVVYIIEGAFDLKIFLPCLFGTVVGGVVGTKVLSKLKNQIITGIFSFIMIVAGVMMILKVVF